MFQRCEFRYGCVIFSNFQLSVRGKNKKEKLGGFFKTITKSADEVLLSNHKVSFQMSCIVTL